MSLPKTYIRVKSWRLNSNSRHQECNIETRETKEACTVLQESIHESSVVVSANQEILYLQKQRSQD